MINNISKAHDLKEKTLALILSAALALSLISVCGGQKAEAVTLTAEGTVSAAGAVLRKSANDSAKAVATLPKDTKLSITGEVFTDKKSTAADKRWYYAGTGSSVGYIRSDYVANLKYAAADAYTTDELNFRSGPATSFKLLGTADSGTPVKILLSAGKGTASGWYKVIVYGKSAYMSSIDILTGQLPAALTGPMPQPDLTGRPKLAKALLENPTNGGKARYVYTFSSKNCKRLFSVKGHSGITTPQGLAYSGKKYYVLYGTKIGQRIVTYSSKGKRKAATKFAFGIGHPNGITWDPATKLCYVFKGHQKKIYTWNPAKNKFGKSKTPQNVSGGSYDASTNLIYGTSKPVMYVYTSEGRFTLYKRIERCNHGITHSAQDCGAAEGFIFHGVSGKNYRKVNFLDVYRIRDGKYLGSIKVKLGEVESAIVDKNGFVELLINHKGKKDYVWKTPLNVKDLK